MAKAVSSRPLEWRPGAARRWLSRRRRWWGGAALTVILAFLAGYPVAMLIYGSFRSTPPAEAGSLSITGYQAVARLAGPVIVNTVVISAVHTVVALGVALILAWLVARTDLPFRTTFEVVISLPFYIPPLITAVAWGMLAGPRTGLINQVWSSLTRSQHSLVNPYSYGGIVWHMMQYAMPFIFLLLVPAFRNLDTSLEEAGRISGGSRWHTMRRITLPLLLPVISSAVLLSFTRGLEAFESPLIFGTPANIQMITTKIYDSLFSSLTPQYPFASATAVVLMVLMLVLVGLQARLLGGRSFVTVSGRGYRPQAVKLGRWRWLAFALCTVYVVITVVLPLGQLLVGSLSTHFGQWQNFTLAQYQTVFSDQFFWNTLFTTAWLSVGSATATMLLGLGIAYLSVRTNSPLRRVVEALAWLPWLMPGIVLGLGLLWAYTLLPGPIAIYGTVWALLLAYTTLRVPLSTRFVVGALQQVGAELDESARVHGGRWWQAVWRVSLPLIWPAFAVGWILAFFGVVVELSATVLLYTPTTETLSIHTLQLWTNGHIEQVAAISLLLLILVVLFKWAERRIGGATQRIM